MRGYGSRYLADLRNFSAAFMVSMVGTLPLLVWAYGLAFPFACAYLLAFGFANIAAFALLTALTENYFGKLLAFMLALGTNIMFWRNQLQIDPGADGSGVRNVMPLLFGQVMFVFFLASAFMERTRIRNWLRRWGTEDDAA